MGNYDHILNCQDGDKDTPFFVPMAGWTPKRSEASGLLPDGIFGFDVVEAKIVAKSANAKTQGKNLQMALRCAEPSQYAGVMIHVWHGFPVGEATNADGTPNQNYTMDVARFQSIVGSIKSTTAGALEAATAETATPVKIAPRNLEGRRLYARTQKESWTDQRGKQRENSKVWFYVTKAEFDAAPGPDASVGSSAPVEQTSRPEVMGAAKPTNGSAKPAAAPSAGGIDQALGL